MDIPSFKIEYIPRVKSCNLLSAKKDYEELDLCIVSNKSKELLEFLFNDGVGKSFYLEVSDNGFMSNDKGLINKLIDYAISLNVKDYISNITTKELLLNNAIEININLKYNRILE